ncbi:probable MNR2-Manganese resistance protein [Rhynchosporium graminicola]|uniref:Probable MNR2-Manganese resistance protein n=1 Tax=Rhynchosporium graminicola TaxID=2792576 RepID=A0A1E1K9U3_9HELO|nr:probable MNR2-Manganese resistance protein [Rhynchosporium commune]
MTAPPPRRGSPLKNVDEIPQRPEPTAIQSGNAASSSATLRPDSSTPIPKKKRNHRGGKKKRRRQSFAASTEDGSGMPETSHSRMNTNSAARDSFYRLQGRNLSNTSIESEALLDHRDQQSIRPRRSSTMGQSAFGVPLYDSPSYRPSYQNPFVSSENVTRRPRTAKKDSEDEDEDDVIDERAPLIPSSARAKSSGAVLGQGGNISKSMGPSPGGRRRSSSKASSVNRKGKTIFDRQSPTFPSYNDEYNVNYPPSVPGSPTLGASNRDMSFGDMMVRDDFAPARASMRDSRDGDSEVAVDDASKSGSLQRESVFQGRRHTIAVEAEGDVCFPVEGMSDMGEEDMGQRQDDAFRRPGPRRRRGKWPDLTMLDEWSTYEKEGRSEERRAKKITEPQLIGGRLRPIHKGWHRAEDDAPYRFTYFNEDFQSTIHSQTISELVQPGGSFRELFIPDPPELSDSSDSEDDEPERQRDDTMFHHVDGTNGDSRAPTRQGSLADYPRPGSRLGGSAAGDGKLDAKKTSGITSGVATPNENINSPQYKPSPTAPTPEKEKAKRFGERPTWWLDVLSPTDAEMKVLSKTFGIHPLTAEDIMMQEAREKVELFRNYYFVNYRSFEQDMNNEDFLEPVNMYVVVFREGVISFHFSMTPHPANVRRRIRQLSDYLILSSDWISYAIIDDITDVFAPLIQNIEDEVDDIDDAILKLHAPDKDEKHYDDKKSDVGDGTSGESGGDMLRRVGDCRKKVMGLYRLLGNKADVIKGFAKRCNEHWEIAPRSEIGLYLGDIQDHIVTMTGNLSHYEKILARSHANYLAQINIKMNERQEQTADVLGKLTVLGTIVLPMNIITGLWGMNVWVPGQQYEGDLTWFWWLTGGLLVFGMSCYFTAKWLYKIV